MTVLFAKIEDINYSNIALISFILSKYRWLLQLTTRCYTEEIISQIDLYLVILSYKTYVFENKMTNISQFY